MAMAETLQLLETPTQKWMQRALCVDADPELFYPDPEDIPPVRQQKIAQAQKICRNCPVRMECLIWAYETGDTWAILGGLTKGQRTRVKNRVETLRTLRKEQERL